jgi:hypothetical protein
MSLARGVRMLLALVLICFGLWLVCRTDAKPERVALIVTAVIGAVTTVYALFTYEILVENQKTAKAALDSSAVMERSLRFSQTPNLVYSTVNTKDPTFKSLGGSITPVENEDYKIALGEVVEGAEQREFVFAMVRNVGQGSAKNIRVQAVYEITDHSNLTRVATVTKTASVGLIEPKDGVALCIFISKVPTPGDGVRFISASLELTDFYREALGEKPHVVHIRPEQHNIEPSANRVVLLA